MHDPILSSLSSLLTRRGFIAKMTAGGVALLVSPRFANAAPKHPTPRPGITGKNVLTAKDLKKTPKLIPLFDSVRDIPQIVDGIHCHCGCTDGTEFYSLLSCYELRGMARDCAICQGQGRLVVRLHSEGKTLDQIRAAIDAKFA